MGISSTVADFVPGAVGPFIDDLPLVTHANIKPYIIAILLHRTAVSFNEIIANVQPHCPQIDLKVGAWDSIENCEIEDKTRLELLVEEVLGEMVACQLLEYSEEKDLWILSLGDNLKNLTTIINWVSATGGQLPQNLLMDMSEKEILRLKAHEKT